VGKVYVGDYGLPVEVETLDNDLSTATAYYLSALKPDGDTVRLPAAGNCTKSGTKLTYTFLAGDLDTAGTWWVQPVITYPSGVQRGTSAPFKISEINT